MNRFENRGNNPTVTIKLKDINSPEKVEKFVDLFGHSAYYGVYHELSEQIHGDGTQQKIMGKMARVDMDTEEGEKKYEKLRSLWQKESQTRTNKNKASVELPIGRETQERIFKNRDLAKDMLGITRYHTAAGFGHGLHVANEKTLRANNQKIAAVEKSNQSVKGEIQRLESKLKELKNS